MTDQEMEAIEGEIVFREILSSFSGATVYIFLEDVSRIDAPSTVVAQVVLPNISVDRDNCPPIRFRLFHPPLNENAHYSLNVLVDIDRDGRVSLGDYISMESYPVSTWQNREARITVRPVI